MKQILLGQFMLLANAGILLISYFFLNPLLNTEYIRVLFGFIGACSSAANFVFSIIVQIDGYQKLKILPTPKED